MICIISSKEEFFLLKKKFTEFYAENFELFCILKKYGVRYLFYNNIYKNNANTEKLINVFSKKWFLDLNKKKDIFEIEGMSISNIINRRISINLTYLFRFFFVINNFKKKKIYISSNCSNFLIEASKAFSNVKIKNLLNNKKQLFMSPVPNRAIFHVPKILAFYKLFRIIQKFLPKKKVLYIKNETSLKLAKKNSQLLVGNTINIFKSFYFSKNNFLYKKYKKLNILQFTPTKKKIVEKNLKKILANFFTLNYQTRKIIKIFICLLEKEFVKNKKTLIKILSIYEDIILFYKPKYIIQSGECDETNIIISELCFKHKIINFLLLDGYQFFLDKFIFFLKYPAKSFYFNKVFAFGSANKKIYLDQGFKNKQIVKINSPLLNKCFTLLNFNKKIPLILGYQPNLNCYKTPFDIQIKVELDLIKFLQSLNYKNIILKLKQGSQALSGVSHKTADYYKYLFQEYFDTKMTINLDVNSQKLEKNFSKTEFIIGGFSTSIIEAIHFKVPYYFYEPVENGYKKNNFKSVRLFNESKMSKNLDELKKNLINKNYISFSKKKLIYKKELSNINIYNY